MKYNAHPTAEIAKNSLIGNQTYIWHFCHIRENVKIGENCTLGRNVYVDTDVVIGDNCKIQNNSSIYHGVKIDDGVFIGPHVVLTNDKNPRAITLQGKAKTEEDWVVGEIHIKHGASIGASSVILPGVIVGEYALVGAGSVVTKDVPSFALVYGNPARVRGKVDKEGKIVKEENV
jgi:UDP-2-acetamido-3-amino-2,3-dideoxy-glucuronate N-acetyltransferase